jgi:hypothetical protein
MNTQFAECAQSASRNPLKQLAFSAAVAVAAFALGSMNACASPPSSDKVTTLYDPATNVLLQPDYAFYKENLDQYLNRRCGTLDCHGQPGRAYRSYGIRGLRLFDPEVQLVSGVQPTTEKERKLNYQSILSLDPEELRRVMGRGGENPDTWLFLRKPMRLERHKGATAIDQNDDGYRCIAAWLKIRNFAQPDGGAPPADAGALVSASEQKACDKAKTAL